MRQWQIKVVAICFGVALLAGASQAQAQWSYWGTVNGQTVHKDLNTGWKWTVTIAETKSSPSGYQQARGIAKSFGYGWDLPTFQDLRTLNPISGEGFGRLHIRTGPFQCYWTTNMYTLGCAYGNGFQTPQATKFIGNNYVIAVRKW